MIDWHDINRQVASSVDYVNGYCGECDEEYTVPETPDHPEKCPICGDTLDT